MFVAGEGFPRADIDVHLVRTLRNRIACLHTDLKSKMGALEKALHELHSFGPMLAALPPESGAGGSQPTQQQPSDAQASSALSPPTTASGTGPSPFALVDGVTAGSPADSAGLRVGDRLVSFGSVGVGTMGGTPNSSSAAVPRPTLQDVAAVVQRSENQSIPVRVLRQIVSAADVGGSSAAAGGSNAAASNADVNAGGDEPVIAITQLVLIPRRWEGPGLLGCHIVPIAAPDRVG